MSKHLNKNEVGLFVGVFKEKTMLGDFFGFLFQPMISQHGCGNCLVNKPSEGVKKMLRSAGVGILVLGMGLFLTGYIGLAGQPSTADLEQTSAQLEELQKKVVHTGKIAVEAKELSIDTALRAAEFKEIVLAKLGLWRAKMAEGLMTTIEAREIARRAEEQMEINKRLQGDMATLQGDMATLQGDMTTLQGKVGGLEEDVKDVQTSVSVAKEMAATAKMEADQARREIKQLARQTQEKTDLLFAKLNDLEKRVRALERLVGKKPVKLKPKKLYPVEKIGKLYKVKKGESLSRIAGHKEVYNDPSKWQKIYQANKNKIANPDIIYPGQRLVIPPE
jgi:nucleoid-associated protein YgaU